MERVNLFMKVRADAADALYMHNYIKKVGSFTRSPGSEGEKKGAEMTAEIMSEFSDEVKTEEFRLAPKAAIGWIRLVVPLYFVALLTFYKAPVLSAFLMLIITVIAVGEFVFYKKIVDPFFPKKTSRNTYGIINPSEKAKQTIIFAGHVDSPYQFNFIKWWGGRVYTVLLVLIITAFITFGIASISLGIRHIIDFFFPAYNALEGVNEALLHRRWLISVFLSPVVALFFFFTTWVETPGCADNLSGVSVALGVGNYLKKSKENNGFFPKHTRVISMAFGSEEAFLRGAMAYADLHKEDLKAQNTVVVNLETLVDPDKFFVLTRDLNSIVKMTPEVIKDILDVSKEAGYEMKKMILPFGGGSTDAAALARAGIKTTSILGMDLGKTFHGKGYLNHYHTVRDTPDKVNPKALQQVLEICILYLKKKDEMISS